MARNDASAKLITEFHLENCPRVGGGGGRGERNQLEDQDFKRGA